MTDKGESVLNGFSIEEIEVLSADIVIDVNQIPLLTANAEIVLKRRITRTLDRLEAALPTFRFYCRYYSDLTDDMVGCIANENGHCNNDECKAIAEVKKAIRKIRGEV